MEAIGDYAVLAHKHEPNALLENFPTPCWAIRAFIEHGMWNKESLRTMSCLEPACGVGHMAKTLKEYFGSVDSADIFPFGYGEVGDFLACDPEPKQYDWVFMNPPFRAAEDFIHKALSISRVGVVSLVRTGWVEGLGRYKRLFKPHPPTAFFQSVERIPMQKGVLNPKGSTATAYGWLVWDKRLPAQTRLGWIPPCRKKFERDEDYDVPSSV